VEFSADFGHKGATNFVEFRKDLGGKMRGIQIAVILALMALTAVGQTVPSQNNGTAPSQGVAPPAAPQSAVSILKPASGEKLHQTFVAVSFSLTNPAASAAGAPNFRLRLDSQDPVTTTSTDYTFTGLTPGAHTVTVQLVDANGTPVPGAQAVVQFSVLRQAARNRGPQAIAAALRLDPSTDIHVQDTTQPAPMTPAGGALPLLSVIGFGVLLGGIASAMKTRT
jgi:hypothetical protein